MTLDEVRRWASGRGISTSDFRLVHDGALLHAISRLLQAIYRESRVTRLSQHARGRWRLDVGRGTVLRAPVSGPLPFRKLETIGRPWTAKSGKRRPIRTSSAFLAALQRALVGSEYSSVFAPLRTDFENSVANIVLNRLLGSALGRKARAIEPAFEGHHYYPFPALRHGPSLPQVVACSNLREQPVDLPLIEIGACRLISAVFTDYAACFRSWSGLGVEEQSGVLLPMHPWQPGLSPLVRELLARGMAAVSRRTVKAMPLASQRTCRVVRTHFDLKLPIDATLTGEHRLLYRLNCENAPVVSALAKQVLQTNGQSVIEFQEDVAAILHIEPSIATHLSAIVRSPVRARRGEVIVPAINLWTGRHEAKTFLRGAGPARAEEFFNRYCRALMTGPVAFCSQWGMAFEPHMQNVYVGFRNGVPSRIVLRDLDNSILDARRVRPLLREFGLRLQKDTWSAMPAFEIGGKRLVQAMLFGHLGEVMWRLALDHGVKMERLAAIVEDTWSDLESTAPSASARESIAKLRTWSNAVKATLRTRLHRSTTMEFVKE